MKKIKTILAFALALNMCVSLAACGKSDESGKKDNAEKKVTTTAAEESEETDDEAADSKAAEEESAAESVEEQPQAAFTYDDCEELFKQICTGANLDEAEKILAEKLDVDIAGKKISEYHYTEEENGWDWDFYCISYTLNTPLDIFGEDEFGNPVPPINKVSIISTYSDLPADSVTFEMSETYDQAKAYEDKTDYKFGTRQWCVGDAIKDIISEKHGEKTEINDGGSYKYAWYPAGEAYKIEYYARVDSDNYYYPVTYTFNVE